MRASPGAVPLTTYFPSVPIAECFFLLSAPRKLTVPDFRGWPLKRTSPLTLLVPRVEQPITNRSPPKHAACTSRCMMSSSHPSRPSLTHQSLPGTSPLPGVHSAHQVSPEIPADKNRALPSAIPTFMPPAWDEEVSVGSQSAGSGRTTKIEL